MDCARQPNQSISAFPTSIGGFTCSTRGPGLHAWTRAHSISRIQVASPRLDFVLPPRLDLRV